MAEQRGRLPFRLRMPYWSVQTPMPPPTQAQPTISTQQPSISLQPTPPQGRFPSRAESQPPSPTRTSQLQPPARSASQPPPQSPSRSVSQLQPETDRDSQPSLQSISTSTSQPKSPSTPTSSSLTTSTSQPKSPLSLEAPQSQPQRQTSYQTADQGNQSTQVSRPEPPVSPRPTPISVPPQSSESSAAIAIHFVPQSSISEAPNKEKPKEQPEKNQEGEKPSMIDQEGEKSKTPIDQESKQRIDAKPFDIVSSDQKKTLQGESNIPMDEEPKQRRLDITSSTKTEQMTGELDIASSQPTPNVTLMEPKPLEKQSAVDEKVEQPEPKQLEQSAVDEKVEQPEPKPLEKQPQIDEKVDQTEQKPMEKQPAVDEKVERPTGLKGNKNKIDIPANLNHRNIYSEMETPIMHGKRLTLEKEAKRKNKNQYRETQMEASTFHRDLLGASTSHEEGVTLQKEAKEGVLRLVHKMVTAHLQHPRDDQDRDITTLEGENKGAYMHVGSLNIKGEGFVQHIHRGYKLNKDDKAEVTRKNESFEGRESRSRSEAPSMTTCMNSNIQSINNSILYNSSCTERNPGVHMALSSSPSEPIELKWRAKILHLGDMHDSNNVHAKKLDEEEDRDSSTANGNGSKKTKEPSNTK